MQPLNPAARLQERDPTCLDTIGSPDPANVLNLRLGQNARRRNDHGMVCRFVGSATAITATDLSVEAAVFTLGSCKRMPGTSNRLRSVFAAHLRRHFSPIRLNPQNDLMGSHLRRAAI